MKKAFKIIVILTFAFTPKASFTNHLKLTPTERIESYKNGREFSATDLSCAGVSSPDLRNEELIDPEAGFVDLINTDLRGANMRSFVLIDPELGYVNLHHKNLRGADFRGVDLRKADLQYSDLSCSDLRGVNMRGANLNGANLNNADLSGANMKGIKHYGTTYSNLKGCPSLLPRWVSCEKNTIITDTQRPTYR